MMIKTIDEGEVIATQADFGRPPRHGLPCSVFQSRKTG